MTREAIIKKTIDTLSILPAGKVEEVADFADYVLKKHEDYVLQSGIEEIVSKSESFNFLNEEDDLYSLNDIIEKY